MPSSATVGECRVAPSEKSVTYSCVNIYGLVLACSLTVQDSVLLLSSHASAVLRILPLRCAIVSPSGPKMPPNINSK